MQAIFRPQSLKEGESYADFTSITSDKAASQKFAIYLFTSL